MSRKSRVERRDAVLFAWIGTLIAGSIGMVALLIGLGYGLSHPVDTAVLAGVALAAERESVRLYPTVEVSVASSSASSRRWCAGLFRLLLLEGSAFSPTCLAATETNGSCDG